jgi:riboflavin kinase / FMN adenylyltransferase
MRVTWLDAAGQRPRRVALGQFDGVHRGHRELIRRCSTVATFDPHPQAVLAPQSPPRLLSSLPRKLELMERIGVAEVVLIPFDRHRAAQEPGDFITDVLVERLNATHVAVGANFRFGRRAAGDTTTLAADGRFTAETVPLLRVDGDIVSSSRIRRLIAEGDLLAAARLLAGPVRIEGVIAGRSDDGRAIVEFAPTSALPPNGRYRCDGSHGHAMLELLPSRADRLSAEGRLAPPRGAIGDAVALDLGAAVPARQRTRARHAAAPRA